MGEIDTLQDHRLGTVEGIAAKNADEIGALRGVVTEIRSDVKAQNATLARIETGTANFGEVMREQMKDMRETEAEDRRAIREAEAQWWSNAWKFMGAALPILGALAGGGYYAATSPGLNPALPAAASPAPSPMPTHRRP